MPNINKDIIRAQKSDFSESNNDVGVKKFESAQSITAVNVDLIPTNDERITANATQKMQNTGNLTMVQIPPGPPL